MTLEKIVNPKLLNQFQVYDRVARALVEKLPKKHKVLKSQLNEMTGIGIDKYAEIFAAVLYDSELLGGNYEGQDLKKPIEVKYANFTTDSYSGSYTASIGGLKNKTADLFLVLSDDDLSPEEPKFLRFFYIPYDVWSVNVPASFRLAISIRKDKTTGGWYKDYELDPNQLFA